MIGARAKPFAVWETEYPEDGCNLVIAASEKGAQRRYRRMTRERAVGPANLTPLSMSVLTTEEALALWRSSNE